jgi:hydroxyethylthiazole kinase-like uncharacterized protein yjeF
MMQTVTAAQMQEYDQYTHDVIGISDDALIERAAYAVLEVIGAKQYDLSHVLVLAGLGNNGADGVAIARLLYLRGINVQLQFVGNVSRAKPNVQKQLAIATAYGLERAEQSDFNEATLIIDAIFGTGLNNRLPDGLQKMIKAANYIQKPVLAVDLPTGIDATTGQAHGVALNAEVTVALNYAKVGVTKGVGAKVAGQVIVKHTGVYAPDELTVRELTNDK